MKKFVEESWLVLLMGIIFAGLLAGTQKSLQAKIDDNKRAAFNNAIQEVVASVREIQKVEGDFGGFDLYKCKDENGRISGWAVDASGPGFIDKIRLVVGLSVDGTKITGMKVVENIETPGLGNKIDSAVDPIWHKQYIGLDATRKIAVQKRPPVEGANEVQAITGATYSSAYVTDIVNLIIEKVQPKLKDYR